MAKKIYVVLNLSNRLAELMRRPEKFCVCGTWAWCRSMWFSAKNKIYVSNWAGRRPATNSVTGPVGEDARVRVDAHGVASEGSATVIDLNHTNQSEILTGRHTCALALSPNGKFLVAANAGDDTLSVIDTRTDKIVETICTRQNPGDLFGAQPNALAFDNPAKNCSSATARRTPWRYFNSSLAIHRCSA